MKAAAANHPDLFPLFGARTVLWEDAVKAYETYRKATGATRPLEELAKRGGFMPAEFAYYYHGIAPEPGKTFETERCGECGGKGEGTEGEWIVKCGSCAGAGLVPKKAPMAVPKAETFVKDPLNEKVDRFVAKWGPSDSGQFAQELADLLLEAAIAGDEKRKDMRAEVVRVG